VRLRLPDGETRYDVLVQNPRGSADTVTAAEADGEAVAPEDGVARIPLQADGGVHAVRVTLGPLSR
jgi:cyclic beta-1,2-glucan synthetase